MNLRKQKKIQKLEQMFSKTSFLSVGLQRWRLAVKNVLWRHCLTDFFLNFDFFYSDDEDDEAETGEAGKSGADKMETS